VKRMGSLVMAIRFPGVQGSASFTMAQQARAWLRLDP
jgi:hypothetical protein